MANFDTLIQYFQSLGRIVWWSDRYITQRFNGRNELGIDYGLPLNTPIASISNGRVVYSQQMNSNPGSSVGYIVQIEGADGSVFHYQHLRSAAVHVGDYVRQGQIVGLSGGCPADGYGNNGCTKHDKYSSGPHIEVRYTPNYNAANGAWNQHWINPQNVFTQYGQGPISDAFTLPGGGSFDLEGSVRSLFADTSGKIGDVAIRALLVTSGVVIATIAAFALAKDAGNAAGNKAIDAAAASPPGRVLGPGIQAEAGAQAGRALIPPVGDERRRAKIREESRRLPALPAAKPPALPPAKVPALPEPKAAEKEPEVYKADEVAAAHRAAKRAEAYKGIDATVKEIQAPELPIPKQAQAEAAQRQRNNRSKRDAMADIRRVNKNIEARLRRSRKRKGEA